MRIILFLAEPTAPESNGSSAHASREFRSGPKSEAALSESVVVVLLVPVPEQAADHEYQREETDAAVE